jgi:pimeloyl-ACP methyl ester carboxylesterase
VQQRIRRLLHGLGPMFSAQSRCSNPWRKEDLHNTHPTSAAAATSPARTLCNALALAVALALACVPIPSTASTAKEPATARPSVVLVHGVFAESSSWDGVATSLLATGHPVVAVANPLRGVKSDAACGAGFVPGQVGRCHADGQVSGRHAGAKKPVVVKRASPAVMTSNPDAVVKWVEAAAATR